MTTPITPSPGENLIPDDELEEVILLTEEVPSDEIREPIEILQLADRSETPAETAGKPPFIDMNDVIEVGNFKSELPPDFSITEADILNFDLETPPRASGALDMKHEETPFEPAAFPEHMDAQTADIQGDDLQRLINEVVHDSQGPPLDFSGMPPEPGKTEEAPAADQERMPSLTAEQVDAALERVLRRLFAERIEGLMTDMITRTVQTEMKNIRSVLADYLSGRTGTGC